MLPTKKSSPITALKEYLILLYGVPKIGKTTLAAQFDDPLFLSLEPGTKSLSVYSQPIRNWKDFTESVTDLKKDKRFGTVIIDTFAKLHDHCMDFVSKTLGVDHPSDAPYGKGFNMMDQEFNKWMNALTATGRGVVLLCHEDVKDIEQRDGTTQTMIIPKASKQARDYINRCVDLVAYYSVGKDTLRYVRVLGTKDILAGNRIDGHFVGITKFSAGNSPQEAYKAFLKAFNTTRTPAKPSFSFK